MVQYKSVAIVGVGLIGGSIALALRNRGCAREVIGIGRRVANLQRAKECGALDTITTNLSQGVATADVIVVCAPVDSIAPLLIESAKHAKKSALITDAGSTKVEILRQLRGKLPPGCHFVGSHPLAGSEKSGSEWADAELFVSRKVVLTPVRNTAKKDIQKVAKFWMGLGAETLEMSPAAHDRALALSSHLPHLVASTMAAITGKQARSLTSTGWNDTTRVAAGDPTVWREILLSNGANVLKSLDQFEKVLASLRKSIESGDAKGLEQLLRKAKQIRNAVGS